MSAPTVRLACDAVVEALAHRTAFGAAEVNGRLHVNLSPISILYDVEEPVAASPDLATIVAAVEAYAQKRGVTAVARDGSVARVVPDGIDYESIVASCLLGALGRTAMEAAEEWAEMSRVKAEVISHARHELTPATAAMYRKMLADGHPLSEGARNVVGEAVTEFAGQWRIAISLIALVNAQDLSTERPQKAGSKSRIVGGKITPYLEHRWVSLKLPAKAVSRQLCLRDAAAIPRRRHEVRGHWCHRHGAGDAACAPHAFVNLSENRRRCDLCGWDEWWRPKHERGDASIGFVTKDYVVEGDNL